MAPESGTVDYRERFSRYSIEQCVQALNGDVGKNGWVSARGRFHIALMERFLVSGYDCSDFITRGPAGFGQIIALGEDGSVKGSMRVSERVVIEGDRIVRTNDVPPDS